MRVMPRYIRKKNTSKSCDCANANTVIPATLVSVQPDRTCIAKHILHRMVHGDEVKLLFRVKFCFATKNKFFLVDTIGFYFGLRS